MSTGTSRSGMGGTEMAKMTAAIGSLDQAVKNRLEAWQKDKFGSRMWAKDPTLWAKAGTPEITDRLGWLTLPEEMKGQIATLTAFRDEIRKEKFTHAVLLGMGGSSLAPEVFQETFGNHGGSPELHVLDSTHPAAVKAMAARVNLPHTLFIVSSKSGTTTEMDSFFYYFWSKLDTPEAQRGKQFIAITDPGTPLQKLGEKRGFRKVFNANPNVGGRYSALTHFGIVPAAIIGVDLEKLLGSGLQMQQACGAQAADAENPGLKLGAVLGEAAKAGRDKVTFSASKSLSHFPVWLEQLIAESTGKEGKGIVPVAEEEPLGEPGIYGKDRIFVRLELASETNDKDADRLKALEAAGHPVVRITIDSLEDLGGEFYRWEVAIAGAGAVIGIQPFNQPDVQLAKDLAKQAMKSAGASGGTAGAGAAPEAVDVAQEANFKAALQKWFASAKSGDYFGIDAYLQPTEKTSDLLEKIRLTLRDQGHAATMLGYGPRFLHSTGQLHKGGPNTGVFLQIIDTPAEDQAVPETDYTFGQLIRAQAAGDATALQQRGRRLLRVQAGRDADKALSKIEETLREVKRG
jgi:transaldolase/glucose-6-phosphate isomerase